jgi:hypothetical protein
VRPFSFSSTLKLLKPLVVPAGHNTTPIGDERIQKGNIINDIGVLCGTICRILWDMTNPIGDMGFFAREVYAVNHKLSGFPISRQTRSSEI